MNYDIIIIGSGPGGYVAAIRAAQLGMDVAVIEKSELGGICLNWGCIPTKALLKSAQVYNYIKHAENYGISAEGSPNFDKIIMRSREIANNMSKGIEFLFKKNKITVFKGFGTLKPNKTILVKSKDGQEEEITGNHIILATGARSKQMDIFKQDGKNIIGYKEALSLEKLPKSMAVIGSGAIGTELAFFYNSMGTEVSLIEFMPNITPLEDEEVSKQLGRSLKKAGIKIMTKTSVNKVDISDGLCTIHYTDKKGENSMEAEIVLSAVGVVSNIENIGLEGIGVKTEQGKVLVDDFYKTNIEWIYAIGDIIPGPALAHVASAEAITCVEKIAGINPPKVDYTNIPSCVYSVPEIASVGITEQYAKDNGIDYKIGKFPFIASGKAASIGNKDGFVKLIFDTGSDELLGAHFIGENITEMISEMVVLKKLKGKGKDLIKSIHPHPSLSEAIMEAAAAAHNEVIHL